MTVSDNVDAVLGTGAGIALDGTLTLDFASSSATDVTIDEKLSGSGTLVLTGNSNQKFGLAQSGSNFDGTVTLDQIGMMVGGSGTGTNNANAFKTADLVLQGGSVLEVATGSTVTTFDKVSVNNGQTAGFKFGGLGFNSDGTIATGTSALVINELVNNGAAQITLDELGTNGDLLGAVAETSLVNGGVDVFQALIQTGIVMDESILENFKLTGVGNGKATQEIKSTTEQVATGYYDFDLALGDSGTDLGVSYDLTRIDISGGKTLTLYETGILDAQLTSESGAGNLTIAAGGKIILANDSANALNSYTGVTNVLGTLTAHAGNLGSTSELQIGAGGHYVNAGDNKVGLLDADGTLELSEGYTLEITQGADKISNIASTLTGGGDLSFAAGELTVSGSSSSNYDGTVYVGSANSEAVLTISGAGALGTGSIVLGTHSGSAVNIYGTEGQTFVNEISGPGTINVDLSGGAFAFGTEQLGLSTGSTLVLDGATFDLTSSDVNFNDDVAGKLAIELTDGSKLINDGSADKDVYSLTLNGGIVDLGEINTEFGQINLVSEKGTLNIINKTTIDIASQSDDNVTESGDRTITDGSELLTGGVFYLDIFTGVEHLTGDIGNLVLDDEKFEGTTEKLLQDADSDSEGLELVANMTRDDGTFEYDDRKVYLEYKFKEIELLRAVDNQGLLVNATNKPGGTLSAKITGSGNLKLDGTLNLGADGTINDYTGKTYVLGDGVVTVQADSAFGQTKDLDIATGGVVKLNGFDQTVGALSGTGKLEFASGSDFTLDNYLDKEGARSIDINNELVGAAGATFTIDGTYGTGKDDHASVSFGRENSLGGMRFTLRNAKFDIGGTGDFDYLTSRSANDFVLSTGAAVTVNGTSGNLYGYNELSFAGGSLDVTNVTLVKEGTGASTAAVIETNKLDLNGNGTLSVAAKIDSSFDVLADDQANFVSTLIKYGELDGNPDNLDPSSTFSSSAIEQGGENVAYVNWTGDITIDETARTVGMSYRVAAIQLADETGDGLKLSTQNTTGVDAALDALVTDYVSGGVTHSGNITFDGGEITIGTGTVDEEANTYTGTTNVRSDSTVTLAKDGAFGRTELLNISNGQVNFNGKSETLGSINVGISGSITGSGSVTLGIVGYDETSSTILGEHSGFTADVTLANGHTLTLNDTVGIGSSGTIKLESGTNLVINDATAGGVLSKTITGEANSNVQLTGSGIGIAANNSGYGGNWMLTDGTTVLVAGDSNTSADDRLGTGGTVKLGDESGTGTTLTISQTAGDFTLDNAFAGSGTLAVSGNGSVQAFGFDRVWTNPNDFTGTVDIRNGISMTVGGTNVTDVGAFNSANLAAADFNLGADSTLIVATQGSVVDTFDNLNVEEGGTVEFDGQLLTDTTTSELGRLQVHTLTGAGDISLDVPTANGDVGRKIAANDLFDHDQNSPFEALITVESGAVSADGWTLNGEKDSGSGLRQAVGTVANPDAYAIYNYGLSVSDTDNDGDTDSLGVKLDLTTVDIVSGHVLTFSKAGTLGARVTDSTGAGDLLISGAAVVLTGENDYEGLTRVTGADAKLTVGDSGLGQTSGLLLESGTAFVNQGTNRTGYLHAESATIDLAGTDDVLYVTGTGDSRLVNSNIMGAGTLALQSGTLEVGGNLTDAGYSGRVNVGMADSGATLLLNGQDGIGTGVISLNSGASKLQIRNSNNSVELTNTVTGSGLIDVNLGSSGDLFEFNGNQGSAFSGTLRLSNAAYHLYNGADKLLRAKLETATGSLVVVHSDSVSDRTIGSLTLNGGVLDFGSMAEGATNGQIVVGSGSGGFSIGNENTTIKVSLSDSNDARGSGVFVGNDGMSVSLIDIKDFNENTDISNIDLHADSDELTQAVNQTDGHTANLTFSGGRLDATGSGIDALWDLTAINLLVEEASKGFRVDASEETGSSGTITAKITGSGNIVFESGTVTVQNAQNDYTGDTYVTGGLLVLGTNEALGDTGLLNVTGGVVDVGATSQSIGSLDIAVEDGLGMTTAGSIELTSGSSVIASANEGITGGAFKLDSGVKLTIENERGAGSVEGERDGADIVMQTGASVVLAFGEEADYGYFSNKLAGENGQYGTVQIGDGENAAYVDLVNTANNFGVLHVAGKGHVRINGMDGTQTALGGADVVIDDNGVAILNGNGSWTLANAFNLSSGGELRLTAGTDGNGGYNTVNFSNVSTQQIDKGGKVTLADAVLYLDRGLNAANADVLADAHLNLESNASLNVGTVAQGDAGLELNSLTLAGGDIYFGGILSVGADQATLGHLTVNTLGDLNGTVHLTASRGAGTGGSIVEESLLDAAANGRYQSLIDVTGEEIKTEDLEGIGLVVTDENGSGDVEIISSIKDSDGVTVAEGAFGYGEKLVAGENGTSAGVNYTLQLINLLNDRELEISESGGLDVRITGEGSLLVSNELELTNKTGEKNDYTGTTTVADSGQLTAGAGALGTSDSHTSALNVSGNFTNAGNNVVDSFNLSGSALLNEGTTLTVTGAGKNAIAGGLSGLGSLDLAGGTTTVTSDADAMSGYSGAVALGKNATLDLGASGSLGTGAITTAADSLVKVEANGARTLTNTLKGAATLDVSGSGIDSSSFAFNAGQEDDLTSGFAGSLSLTSVTYDFTQNGNDALNGASLTLDGVKLVVNDSDSVGNRLVNGLTINGTGSIIDFGQIGNGTGVIDLQGEDFDVNAETMVTLNTKLAGAITSDGSAAFDENVSGAQVTLVTDARDITEEDLSHLVSSVDGQSVSRELTQGGYVVAKLHGTFGDFSVSGESGQQDLNLGLGFSQLEIQGGKTYSVSETGTISLKITDVNGKGGLTVAGKGNDLTLTNGGNEYEGATNVLSGAGLVLTADSALGRTELLNTASGTSVDFGATSQTVGMIKSDGSLKSDANKQGTHTLTVAAGGSVAGANDNFHLNWALNAGQLQINNVMSLGTGSAEVSDGASIVITGAEGEFKNALTGAGDLRVTNGANVELAGSNALTGDLTVADTATVSASGDINSHIGKGDIALAGKAEFTLTEGTDDANWTWERNLTCSGELTLAREGSNDQTLLFAESSLSGFTGTVALDDWTIELNENVDNGTLAEFAKWKTGTLVLRDGANALVTGVADLGAKNAKLDAGGILTINDFGVPGMDSNSYLEANALELSEGFVINLETGNETVDSSTILTQDDAEAMQTTVVKTDNEIVLANGKVTVNGSDAGDTIRFDISQTSGVEAESGNVAKGIYTYKIVASDSKTDLAVEYDLAGISLNSGKTLVLKGIAGDEYGNESGSQLNVYLTGEGNVRIAENTVRLNAKSDYEGATTVSSGATVYAVAGALGDTSKLTVEGTGSMHVDGSNAVRALAVNENGSLWIGNTDIEHPSDDITLTLKSDETAGSVIAGSLRGTGNLAVEGNGQVDAGYKPDLSITSSTGGFHGDLVLDKGAWVELATDTNTIFGSNDPSLSNDILVSEASRLTINSTSTETVSLFGVFRDGSNDVEDNDEHGGTVIMHLGAADSKFQFAREQEEMAVQEGKDLFTGTLQLTQGTIDFTDLYNGDEDDLQKTALHGTTLVLGDNANLVLGDNADAARELGGLTMAGGTIHAGAIGYTEGQGVSTSTINLNGGELSLSEGTDSTVIFDTSSDATKISDAGSEILRAGSLGSDVLLVKGIGQVNLDGKVLDKNDVIGSGYLNANLPADAEQLVKQDVSTESGEAAAEVADVKREFTNKFYYDQSEGTLSIAYTVSEIGLRHTTAGVNTSNYTNDLNWQGLTLTAINGDGDTNVDDPLAFGTLIRDGSSGVKGNIVFKGASGADSILLTRENSYAGKTWLTKDVHVVFGSDSGFGTTEALRVDTGSSVNFAGFNQTMGALFALGSDALKGAGNLTVNGVAVIEGANADLSADWTFNNEVAIKDAFALGKGSVALAGTTSKLTVNGVQGDIVNAITGGAGTSLVLTNGDNVNTNVNFTTKDILGGTAFTGSVDIASGTSAGFTLTSGTAIGNELDVAAGGTLRISSENGGNLSFANSETNISGTLDITNVTLNAAANKDRFTNASLSAHAGAEFEVTEVIGEGVFKDLSFTDGSTIKFANGTPGEYGDNAARIDLGDEGTLSFAETVNIELDLDDYVNASEVSEIQTGLQNKRLTAQDLTTKNESVLSNLISAGKVNGGLEDLNLEASGASGGTLTIGIRNDDRDTEDVAEGTYGFKLNTNGGLNLAYGLTSVKIKDGKTLKLAGVGSSVSEDNILTAAVHGTGDLEITEGLIALTNGGTDAGKSTYTGQTIVDAHAQLVTGTAGGTLGETSKLDLKGYERQSEYDDGFGGRAHILGAETVGSLNVGENAVLNISDTDTTNGHLTIEGKAESTINGVLRGAGGLDVQGSTLTVTTSNTGFTGDVSVASGATIVINQLDSLGAKDTAGVIKLAEGGNLNVTSELEVDATSSASRTVGTISNAVTGDVRLL